MTSVDLITTVTVSPFFRPSSSALLRVITLSTTFFPTRTVTCAIAHLLHHVGGSCPVAVGCNFENGLVTRFFSRLSRTGDEVSMDVARVAGRLRRLGRPCPPRQKPDREKRNPCRRSRLPFQSGCPGPG